MADIYSEERRSAIMSRIRSRDTLPERIVRATLHRLGLRFRLVDNTLPGKPDIVLRTRRTVVFVNGCYWHGHDCTKGKSSAKSNVEFWAKKLNDNKTRDGKNCRALSGLGWRVVIVWECETRDTEKLGSKLAEEFNV